MSTNNETQQLDLSLNKETTSKKHKKYSRSFPESEGDEIVISGMAGKFPNSHNIAEYEQNLYNKVHNKLKCQY